MLKVGDVIEKKRVKSIRYEISNIYESDAKGYYWVIGYRIHWNRGYWTTFGNRRALGVLEGRQDNLMGYTNIGKVR